MLLFRTFSETCLQRTAVSPAALLSLRGRLNSHCTPRQAARGWIQAQVRANSKNKLAVQAQALRQLQRSNRNANTVRLIGKMYKCSVTESQNLRLSKVKTAILSQ